LLQSVAGNCPLTGAEAWLRKYWVADTAGAPPTSVIQSPTALAQAAKTVQKAVSAVAPKERGKRRKPKQRAL
jgi:hypothetical protein